MLGKEIDAQLARRLMAAAPQPLVDAGDVDLAVERPGAAGQVGRADREPGVVDDHQLGVHVDRVEILAAHEVEHRDLLRDAVGLGVRIGVRRQVADATDQQVQAAPPQRVVDLISDVDVGKTARDHQEQEPLGFGLQPVVQIERVLLDPEILFLDVDVAFGTRVEQAPGVAHRQITGNRVDDVKRRRRAAEGAEVRCQASG